MDISYSLYHLLYYSICLFFFLIYSVRKNKKLKDNYICLILVLIISLLVGSRGILIGTDTFEYHEQFLQCKNNSWLGLSSGWHLGSDPILYYFLKIGSFFNSFNVALILVSLLTNYFLYRFCNLIHRIDRGIRAFPLFFLLLITFSTFNFEFNVIRSGLGLAITLNASIYLYLRKYKLFITYSIIGILIHFSMLIPIAIFTICNWCKFDLNKYLYIYIISIIVAYLGYSVLDIGIFHSLKIRQIQTYTTFADPNYDVGFKLKFVLYNSMFLFLFLLIKKNIGKVNNNIKYYFLRFFLLSSSLFFLWFSLPYSDRMGVFSWTVIPLCMVLSYEGRRKIFKNIIKVFPYFYFIICYILSGSHIS